MAAALLQHGAIRTTEPKAKQLRRFVEKLITTAKQGTLHARRQVIAALVDRDIFDDEGQKLDQTIVQKLFNEIAPRYADRPGGYTRIVHLAERRIGDSGKQVLLQLVEEEGVEPTKPTGMSRRKKQAEKRRQAASAVAVVEPQPPDQAPADDAAEADDAPEAPEATDAPDQKKED